MSTSKKAQLKEAIDTLKDSKGDIERIVKVDGIVKVYTFSSFNHWANDRGVGGCQIGLTGLRRLGIIIPFLPWFSHPEVRDATAEEEKQLDEFGPLSWTDSEMGWGSRAA